MPLTKPAILLSLVVSAVVGVSVYGVSLFRLNREQAQSLKLFRAWKSEKDSLIQVIDRQRAVLDTVDRQGIVSNARNQIRRKEDENAQLRDKVTSDSIARISPLNAVRAVNKRLDTAKIRGRLDKPG